MAPREHGTGSHQSIGQEEKEKPGISFHFDTNSLGKITSAHSKLLELGWYQVPMGSSKITIL